MPSVYSDTDSRATIEDSGCRHFVRECVPEDSIKAADQISDKEPEGVQNSSGAACFVIHNNSRYSKLAHG